MYRREFVAPALLIAALLVGCGAGLNEDSASSSAAKSSTSTTVSEADAATACTKEPYLGSFNDPQVDTFYKLAQFDACIHRKTGITAYDAEGRSACNSGDSIPRLPGGRKTNSNYCPYPY